MISSWLSTRTWSEARLFLSATSSGTTLLALGSMKSEVLEV